MRLYNDTLEETKTIIENLIGVTRTPTQIRTHTRMHGILIYIKVYVKYVPSGPRTETLCLRAVQSLVNCPTK